MWWSLSSVRSEEKRFIRAFQRPKKKPLEIMRGSRRVNVLFVYGLVWLHAYDVYVYISIRMYVSVFVKARILVGSDRAA